MLDIYLTPAEVSEILGITVQGLHKFLKENEIETQVKGERKHRIRPEQLNQILKLKNIELYPGHRAFAVHTLKGGVGKSTITHALGARASAYGKKVLLVDLDKQANLTNSFGVSDDEDLITLFELYESYSKNEIGYSFKDAVFELTEFLHLIPARLELANLDLAVQLKQANIDKLFDKLLDGAKEAYDLILFDLPADFNRVTIATHSYVDTALIPINMDAFSLKGLKLTQQHIDYVQKEYSGTGDYRVIINKFDARNTMSFEIMADLNVAYKGTPYLCSKVIPVSKPVENAFAEGESIWSLSKSKVPALEGFDSVLQAILNQSNFAARRSEITSTEVVEGV